MIKKGDTLYSPFLGRVKVIEAPKSVDKYYAFTFTTKTGGLYYKGPVSVYTGDKKG